MKITTRHPESRNGIPVVLDAYGQVMTPPRALKRFRDERNLSWEELGRLCGVSARTVECWESGRYSVSVAALNVLRDHLEDERTKVLSKRLPPLPRLSRAHIKDWLTNTLK